MALAAGLAPLAGVCPAAAEAPGIWLAQTSSPDALHITVAPVILGAPAAPTPLPITVGPAGALPRNSFLRLRGLPPMVSLSQGYAIAPGAWAVPLLALPDLFLNVPVGVAGRSEIRLALVTEDGVTLAEASTALVVAPMPRAAAPEPKSAPPPARKSVAPPPLPPEERERAERLIARGESDLKNGNIALARQFFLRAAEAGLARGALLLATTYDPRELARLGAQGVQPNLAEARKWYERARELGAPEAEERLARLGGG